jgi:hypothetical protein
LEFGLGQLSFSQGRCLCGGSGFGRSGIQDGLGEPPVLGLWR